jgi:uncharacterized protein (UPF0332 family)
MTAANERYLTDKEILTRIIRIETSINHEAKALLLARELSDKHFESLNNAAMRLEKLEGTFATKESLQEKIDTVVKLVQVEMKILAGIASIIPIILMVVFYLLNK